MELNDLFVVRLGGIPTTTITDVEPPELESIFLQLDELSDQIDKDGKALADEYFLAIPLEAQPNRRRALIRARRALYNKRELPKSDQLEILSVDDHASRRLVQYLSLVGRNEAVRRAFADLVNEVEVQTRRMLRNAGRASAIRNGILLSSQALYSSLDTYIQLNSDTATSKHLQTERGLLKYVLRTAMKATPFASFCTVVAGKKIGTSATESCGSLAKRISVVKLNKLYYGLLWAYLKGRPEVRESLVVQTNPTLTTAGSEIVLLSTQGDREVVRRIRRSPALDFVIAETQRSGGRSLRTLAHALADSEHIDADAEEAFSFLDGLLRLGVLRYENLVRSQDSDWARTLASRLSAFTDSSVQEICASLQSLATDLDVFRESQHDKRDAILGRIQQQIDKLTSNLGLAKPRLTSVPIFEDCGAEMVLTRKEDEAISSLKRYVEIASGLAVPRSDMASMRAFFDREYSSEVRSVSLLDFYEHYYKGHLKAHLAMLKQVQDGKRDGIPNGYSLSNPFGVKLVEEIQRAKQEIVTRIRVAWAASPDQEEIHVPISGLEEVVPKTASSLDLPVSMSVFAQWLRASPQTNPRVVVGGGTLYLGFGKYFSRFLEQMSPEHTERERERYRRITNVILAEVASDANFNANFHPDLVPFEIAYPNGDGEPSSNAISCTDLVVERDPADQNRLLLRHRLLGRPVVPLDLGFLNPRMRPALFQMLVHFSPPAGFSIPIPDTLEKVPDLSPSKLPTYRPRILLGSHIVIARRRWTVPSALVPRRAAGESMPDYLSRFNSWRAAVGFPAKAYVRLFEHPDLQPVKPTLNTPAKRTPNEAMGAVGNLEQEWMAPEEHQAQATARNNGHKAEEAEEYPSEREAEGGQDRTKTPRGVHQQKRRSRDLVKPQYTSFLNPVHLDCLTRVLVSGGPLTLVVEEVLPGGEALDQVDSKQYATEYVLQFNGWEN